MTRRELVKRSAIGGTLSFSAGVYLVLNALDDRPWGALRVGAVVGAALSFFLVALSVVQAVRTVRGDFDERLKGLKPNRFR